MRSRHRNIWVDGLNGDDDGDGTVSAPYRTFVRAMQDHRRDPGNVGHPREIVLRHGSYELDEDGLALLQRGLVTVANDGVVVVNNRKVEVRRRRQPVRGID